MLFMLTIISAPLTQKKVVLVLLGVQGPKCLN